MAGKGLTKIVQSASKQLGNVEVRVDEFFYGKGKRKGLYATVQAINEVDPCNIINYFLTKANTKLIKNEETLRVINRIKTTAGDINQAISEFITYSPIDNNPRSPDTPALSSPEARRAAGTDLRTAQKLDNLFKNLRTIGTEFLSEIPPEVITFFPKLKSLTGPLQDFQSILTRYGSISTIPNDEVQKIVQKVYKFQGIISAVASIDSLQGIVGLSPELQRQIQKLQKTLDPSKLLPTLKRISRTIATINQTSLQILKIISIARLILKIITAIMVAIRFIIIFFQTNPLPSMFVTEGVSETLNTVKQKARETQTGFEKFLTELRSLLGIVSDFIVSLLGKINLLGKEIDILIIKIEACAALKDSPIAQELNNVNTLLKETTEKLKPYLPQPPSRLPSKLFGGILISVVEEELVDEGRTLKRRRAIAVDERGLLIKQGPLTFATDATLLIEELRFQLVQEGSLSETNYSLSTEEQGLIDEMSIFVGLEVSPEESLAEQQGEVQVELSSFIDGLKNSRRLRKKVQAALAKQTATLKTVSPSTGTLVASTTASAGGSSTNSNLLQSKTLSQEEKDRLQKRLNKLKSIRPTNSGARKEILDIERKLKEDADARKQLAAG